MNQFENAQTATLIHPSKARAGTATSGSVRFAGIRHFLSLLLSALREIFDESAYARFLERNQVDPSRAAYAAFLHEHAATKARRPRCC